MPPKTLRPLTSGRLYFIVTSVMPMVCVTSAFWLLRGSSSRADCAEHRVAMKTIDATASRERRSYMRNSLFAKFLHPAGCADEITYPGEVMRRLDGTLKGRVSGRVTRCAPIEADARSTGTARLLKLSQTKAPVRGPSDASAIPQ